MKPKKLKRYNTTNIRTIRIGKATIRFYKAGQITLSTSAVQNMNLKKGDKIEFLQDENEPSDWYITKSNKGFELRKYTNSNALICNSSSICHIFLKTMKKNGVTSAGCLMATEPETIEGEWLWAIITSSIN